MGATKVRRSGRGFMGALAVMALLVAVMAAAPGGRAGAAEKTPPGDPPGNNGTVKIDQSAAPDEDKGNEPIGGDDCAIWLKFYGFDQAQKAVITFTAHPPTGTKVLLVDSGPDGNGVVISEDPAGGGQDEDAVIGYDLTSAVQGLKAQAKQGYHIKLDVDVKGAPGAAKHKVFWIKCTPAPSTTLRIAKALQGTGTGPFGFDLRCNHRILDTTFTLAAGEKHDVTNVPPGTTCVVTEIDSKGAQSTTISENPPDGKPDDGQVKLAKGVATAVTFTNVFPGTGGTPAPDNSDLRNPNGGSTGTGGTTGGSGGTAGTTGGTGAATPNSDNSVLGGTATRTNPAPAGTTLPRTGADLLPLAATGFGSLAAGGLGLLAGRRRRRS